MNLRKEKKKIKFLDMFTNNLAVDQYKLIDIIIEELNENKFHY